MGKTYAEPARSDEQNQRSLSKENEFKHQSQDETQKKLGRLLHSSHSPATLLFLISRTQFTERKYLCSVVIILDITQEIKCCLVTNWFSQKKRARVLVYGAVINLAPVSPKQEKAPNFLLLTMSLEDINKFKQNLSDGNKKSHMVDFHQTSFFQNVRETNYHFWIDDTWIVHTNMFFQINPPMLCTETPNLYHAD